MDIPDLLLHPAWHAGGWFVFAAGMVLVVSGAPWGRLAPERTLHRFLGAITLLMLAWSLRAGVRPGLHLHVLGTTLLFLMFGARLAVVAGAIVLVVVTVSGPAGWASYGVNGCLVVLLPVAVSSVVLRGTERFLPPNPFAYLFLGAFGAGALAMAMVGLAATLVMTLSGAYAWRYLATEFLPFFVLIAWSEALLTGMAATLMVVYRPDWIPTFRDDRYLRER
jgi:uncharacterized membrane protein